MIFSHKNDIRMALDHFFYWKQLKAIFMWTYFKCKLTSTIISLSKLQVYTYPHKTAWQHQPGKKLLQPVCHVMPASGFISLHNFLDNLSVQVCWKLIHHLHGNLKHWTMNMPHQHWQWYQGTIKCMFKLNGCHWCWWWWWM